MLVKTVEYVVALNPNSQLLLNRAPSIHQFFLCITRALFNEDWYYYYFFLIDNRGEIYFTVTITLQLSIEKINALMKQQDGMGSFIAIVLAALYTSAAILKPLGGEVREMQILLKA